MNQNNFVYLESVGTGIDPRTGNGYPALRGGGYDMNAPVGISETCSEWYGALTVVDAHKLMTLAQDLGGEELNEVKQGMNHC